MGSELARDLINAGVHFGHGASRWNPKMAPYIFSKRGMIHIIDVKQTLKGVLLTKKLAVEVVSSGQDVVFVGTKRQAQKAVIDAATQCGMHYVSNRWLGGILTNFRTIRSRLQRLEELEAMAEDGSIESESKKRASTLKREMRKIKANLDGVRKMSKLPGLVVAVDVKKEHLALREARKLGIVTVGIIDTDSDPDAVDIAIPANDDSIKAIGLILNEIALAVAQGKTMVKAAPAQRAPRQRKRSLVRAAVPAAAAPVAETTEAAPEKPAAVEPEKPVSTDETLQADPAAPAQE